MFNIIQLRLKTKASKYTWSVKRTPRGQPHTNVFSTKSETSHVKINEKYKQY